MIGMRIVHAKLEELQSGTALSISYANSYEEVNEENLVVISIAPKYVFQTWVSCGRLTFRT